MYQITKFPLVRQCQNLVRSSGRFLMASNSKHTQVMHFHAQCTCVRQQNSEQSISKEEQDDLERALDNMFSGPRKSSTARGAGAPLPAVDIEEGIKRIPTPGKSSGDESLDKATRKWRLSNTEDDERFQQVFQKEKDPVKLRQQQLRNLSPGVQAMKVATSSTNSNGEQTAADQDDEDDLTRYAVAAEDPEKYVLPYNPETGERYGPKGPEPTRFGDWEIRGRVSDF